MKKLLFAFALLMGTTFMSCNNSGSATTDTIDSVEVVTDSVSDSIVVDSIVADSLAIDTIG